MSRTPCLQLGEVLRGNVQRVIDDANRLRIVPGVCCHTRWNSTQNGLLIVSWSTQAFRICVALSDWIAFFNLML